MTPDEISDILGTVTVEPRWNRIRRLTTRILAENMVMEPPVNVNTLLPAYGLQIFQSDLPPDMAGLIAMDKRIILVNEDDPGARQSFTVAHEFGHFIMHSLQLAEHPEYAVLHRSPLGANKDTIEKEADYFAATLLVPPFMLRQLDNYSNSDLAILFAVSPEVIPYRLIDERIRQG